MKKIAVISDATSTDFFFPVWKRYYGDLFGLDNLYIITYSGMRAIFANSGISHIWEINSPYNDELRARIVSHLVTVLLETYDVVLRCDVDEFLVPDKEKFSDLREFVEKNNLPYVTAHGIDILELQTDAELDFGRKILVDQRKFGIYTTPLNKTSLTTTPTTWAAGFHATDKFPIFSRLFILHLKYADIKGRQRWNEFMLSSVEPGTREHKYFSDSSEHLSSYPNWYSQLKKRSNIRDGGISSFDRKFLDSVTYNPLHNIYAGEFETQDFLIEIDSIYENIF